MRGLRWVQLRHPSCLLFLSVTLRTGDRVCPACGGFWTLCRVDVQAPAASPSLPKGLPLPCPFSRATFPENFYFLSLLKESVAECTTALDRPSKTAAVAWCPRCRGGSAVRPLSSRVARLFFLTALLFAAFLFSCLFFNFLIYHIDIYYLLSLQVTTALSLFFLYS